MKKFLTILLALLIISIPLSVNAAQAPLELSGNSVYVPDESQVDIVAYNAFFRMRTGFSSGNTSITIKNPDLENPVNILMGMPQMMNNVSMLKDLTVIIDGEVQKTKDRKTLQNPPTERQVEIAAWKVWEVNLEANESKVIECSFSFDNKLELDGTEVLSFPLGLIRNWDGKAKNVTIVTDLDFYGPYAFDPLPNMTPSEYEGGGRIIFQTSNPDNISSSFDIAFKPMDVVISRYINERAEIDKDIKDITEAYRNKSYSQTINLIHDYLEEAEETSLLNELKYLESLSYLNLYDLDKALNLFNQLEKNPGFEPSLSSTIKRKIAYDKYNILKQNSSDDEALEYLLSLDDDLLTNSIFALWLQDEIKIKSPEIVIEEEEEEDEEEEIIEEPVEKEEETPDEKGLIVIGGKNFFIEEIVIALGALIILIIIISIIVKRRRKRRRGSFFRY